MTFKTMIATSAVALALATSAMADSNFTGAYVGGNFGYGAGKSKFDNNEGAANTTQKTDFGLSGAVGGLHGGYQHQFGMLVAGIEGAFNLSNTDATTTVGNVKTSIKRKHAYGLAARFGAVINNWMAYTKLGWERARFDFKISGSADSNDDFSKKKNLNAFVAGLGFETLVAEHVMLGAEWTTSFYKKTSISSESNPDTYKTHISDFKVRLGYKF